MSNKALSSGLRRTILCCWGIAVAALLVLAIEAQADERPNILFAISDDQSWRHAGAYGDPVVKTPAFDRVAREGVLFRHAFCSSPSCTPSRGAILTGQQFWRLEQGANLMGTLPAKFAVYPDLLEAAGYFVGGTGKGWAPGNHQAGGRTRNPAGPWYTQRKMRSVPATGINRTDYAGNFADFLRDRPEGKPFCFWYGGFEPHRVYEQGSGAASGKRLADVPLPKFFPDATEVRGDVLDYYLEIEWFDNHLGKMLAMLETRGELDNTIVVVTSDNGMPFPRAKTNLYDYGARMPLAIRWPRRVPGGRKVDDLVSLTDLAPTYLEAAGLPVPKEMTGQSLLAMLTSEKSGQVEPQRKQVFFGRERHGWNRDPNVGYPCRAIRTHEYLLIRNYHPERQPGFDTDWGPTRDFLLAHQDTPEGRRFHAWWFDARAPVELYDLRKDVDQVDNVAGKPQYAETEKRLTRALEEYLKQTADPRILGKGDVFDDYRYYSRPTRNVELYRRLHSKAQGDQ